MLSRWSAGLISERDRHSVAALFVVVLLTALAIRASLPIHPIALEIPTTAGTQPGAAPQESIAPHSLQLPVAPPAPPLSTEATPADTPLANETAVLSAADIGIRGARSIGWVDRLPLVAPDDGAGNSSRHIKQPTLISMLVGTILKSLQPIRTTALSPRKPLPLTHTRLTPRPVTIHPILSLPVTTPGPSIPPGRIGGPKRVRAVLGGPISSTAHHAPVINGLDARPYR